MLDKSQLFHINEAALQGRDFEPGVILVMLKHIAELEEQVSDLENQLTEVMERM